MIAIDVACYSGCGGIIIENELYCLEQERARLHPSHQPSFQPSSAPLKLISAGAKPVYVCLYWQWFVVEMHYKAFLHLKAPAP